MPWVIFQEVMPFSQIIVMHVERFVFIRLALFFAANISFTSLYVLYFFLKSIVISNTQQFFKSFERER